MVPPSRNETLDVLKGVAIILMVQVHCYGWWLDRSLRTLPLFTTSLVLGWFAGPLFLFSIGCALALSVQRRHRAGQSRRAVTIHVLRRAALIFLGGYALSFVTFAGTPRSDIQSVGVLQCIGLSIFVSYIALCWLPRFVPSLAAVAVVLLTPLLRAADVLAGSPVQALLVNVPYESNYSLFPWAAYALIGVDVGRLLIAFDEHPQQLGEWLGRLLIAGALLACLCGAHVATYIFAMTEGRIPTEVDVQIAFWYPLPAFNLFHGGCLLVEFTALAWLLQIKGLARPSAATKVRRTSLSAGELVSTDKDVHRTQEFAHGARTPIDCSAGSAIFSPLAVMGRAALPVFVGHHILGYRIVYSLEGMNGVYGTMSATCATIGVLLMLILSWLSAESWVRYGRRLWQ